MSAFPLSTQWFSVNHCRNCEASDPHHDAGKTLPWMRLRRCPHYLPSTPTLPLTAKVVRIFHHFRCIVYENSPSRACPQPCFFLCPHKPTNSSVENTIVVAKMRHDALERIHGGLTSGTSPPTIHESAKPSGPRTWSTALEGEEIMCLDYPGPRGRYLWANLKTESNT
ncbi:hypothetical protein ARMSODRAFT_748015 [Armillaria solidipes]|uniref:Uncharacterized protein n=1 Tax=Armillaria solidipes TaxID=1076256 RepID=A0A2H3BMV6_9AGAR|nr:hypothetical protein ARMSODRAFT_748015 [Armillaria solidipes]